MNKKTKNIVILGGVAAAGVAFWYFFFGPGSSTSATSTGVPGSMPGVLPWANPANAAEVNTVTGWINSIPSTNVTGPAQWLKYMQTLATQQDIDTMSVLIEQYWDAQVAPPFALDNYFTALGAKVAQVTIP